MFLKAPIKASAGLPGLRGSTGWLRADGEAQVAGPTIRNRFPIASLASEDHQVFATLFAPLADRDRNQHFAATRFVGQISKHFHSHGLQFDFSQAGVQSRKKKFTNGSRSPHCRNVGTENKRIRGVEVDE